MRGYPLPRDSALIPPLLGGVNEHPFTGSFVRDGHDPVLSTTILTHDSIDDTNMSVTLRVDHATILTTPHSGQNLVEAIHIIHPQKER